MSAQDDGRPIRILAAWGYTSSEQFTVEVDVWTINETVPERDDEGRDNAERRARMAFGARIETIVEAYGNVARVEYAGAAGEGYRYIDPAETNPGVGPNVASQQAYAGAKRSAGGDRDEGGRIEEGYVDPDAPGLSDVVEHGRDRVIPAAAAALQADGRIGMARAVRDIPRDSDRDEEEPVETEPVEEYRNELRIDPNDADQQSYGVDVRRQTLGAAPGSEDYE
jgi:hypothetical protein